MFPASSLKRNILRLLGPDWATLEAQNVHQRDTYKARDGEFIEDQAIEYTHHAYENLQT